MQQCIICKEILFRHLKDIADRYDFRHVVDGTNYDDWLEEREVFKIQDKFNIKRPLVEARIASEEVRSLLKTYKLPNWNQPPYSCSKGEMYITELISLTV